MGGDVVVNEFDQDERRKREVNRFVASFSRDCQQFIEETTTRRVTDEPSGMLPNLIGYTYSIMPELPGLVGAETFNTLVAQQTKLAELSGDLFTLQLERQTAAFRGTTQQSADTLSASFDKRKEELLARAAEHCAFLQTLQG